uniref:Uncharacterized LOC111923089 n=1 Tax=Cyanistes caeruleus TaxID=156563 RepID=A0A8C0VDD7_CYACU
MQALPPASCRGPLLPAATSLRLLPPTVCLHSGPTEQLLCVLLQTMALLPLLFVLVQSLIQYPQPAGDGLDEATHRQMQERQELLDREMARLLQELEQGPPEQQDEGWGAVLFGALQQWPFWVLAGVLLLLGLWFSCSRRSREASSSGKDQSSCKTLRDERGIEQEGDSVDSREGEENIDVTVEADNSSSGNDREGSPVASNEGDDDDAIEGNDEVKGKEDSDVKSDNGRDLKKDEGLSDENVPGDNTAEGNEEPGNVAGNAEGLDKANGGANKDVQVEQDKDAGKEEEGDGNEEKNNGGNMKAGNRDVNEGEDNVDGKEEYTDVQVQESSDASEQRSSDWTGQEDSIGIDCGKEVDNSGFPATEEENKEIEKDDDDRSKDEEQGGVNVERNKNKDRKEDEQGHAFHPELNSAGQVAARTFSVRVELVCTCKREQLGKQLLCFVHHSQEELRRKRKRSLLETLCTGSYLDVEKTSRWFRQLVRSSWLHVPQAYSWHLVFQPCRRSCQFQLSKGKKSVKVEMLFGVRQGDSDIFVVSQPTEAQKGSSSISVSSQLVEANFIARTVWPETYAVAEVKFFRHIARQVPCENLHLKCLQVFTCILRGTGFSSSTWKTVVMHVLTIVPLSRWSRREFAQRLWDIMAYLHCCLQLKRLEHFVLGNERLPAEISLPPALQGVEPLNLFEHLARDPAAHREAMQAYGQLRFRLWMLLSSH